MAPKLVVGQYYTLRYTSKKIIGRVLSVKPVGHYNDRIYTVRWIYSAHHPYPWTSEYIESCIELCHWERLTDNEAVLRLLTVDFDD